MGKYKNISDFYGKKLAPAEDDYSADSFPGQAKHKEMDFSLIITDPKDEARRNGEVRIIKEERNETTV